MLRCRDAGAGEAAARGTKSGSAEQQLELAARGAFILSARKPAPRRTNPLLRSGPPWRGRRITTWEGAGCHGNHPRGSP